MQRGGETPEIFLQNSYKLLDAAFEINPQGTPAKECLEYSLRKNSGKRISRYFFCDGVPNRGEAAKNAIAQLVKHLGVQTSLEEYRRYFNGFNEALQTRKIENNKDVIKARHNWESFFHEFVVERSAKNILGVKNFQQLMKT
ncbi:MAG: hypothetical protein H0X29_06220 [Parachlamydiaceae bacterium]|nr:hypothetical protein [Parachlamydiaceae bacterium]